MAFIPVHNCLEAQLVFNQQGEVVENTLYFAYGNSTEIDYEAESDLAAALADWWDTYIKSLVAPDTSLLRILVTDLNAVDGLGIEYSSGLPIAGTAGSGSAPNNVTLAIKFATGLRGRSNRGRNYIVGLPQQYVADNSVNGAYVANWVNSYQLLTDTENTAGFSWSVASRYHNNAPRTPAGVTNLITQVSVTDLVIDSQRRRLPGRGQ